jgi:hypothetical protein
MTQQLIKERLLYIKYLFQLGQYQSMQSNRIAFSSILCFHDAIDMFMQLSAEKMGITEKVKKQTTGKLNPFMMDYFLLMPELSLEPSIKKINNRRNNLKHLGQLPASNEIEESRIIAGMFFEENTPKIFNLNFEDVFLSNIIQNNSIKVLLVDAENLIEKEDYIGAAEKIGQALHELINNDKSGHSIFNMSRRIIRNSIEPSANDARTQFYIKSPFDKEDKLYPVESYIYDAFNAYNQNFQFVQQCLELLSLGANEEKYILFRRIIPDAPINNNGSYTLKNSPWNHNNNSIYNNKNLHFALDFIIEIILKAEKQVNN